MRNMNDVRANLTHVFDGLKSGAIQAATACEMNNACGKVLHSVKLELEYFKLTKEPPNIPFLANTVQLTEEQRTALRALGIEV